MANPIMSPTSHPTYNGNQPSDNQVTSDALPTFNKQLDAQSYNQSGFDIQMGDPKELLSICDLCNDIMGEHTFQIDAEGPWTIIKKH